jgi:hypothetical protein
VIETAPARRDTLVLAVNGAGDKYHQIIEHRPAHKNRVTGEKVPAVKGLHKEHLHPFIEGIYFETKGSSSLMIQDNLRAHHAPNVVGHWIDRNISPEYIPPQAARFASVLDRNLFAVTKSRLKQHDCSTITSKKESVAAVINNLEPEVIKKCWHNCGYEFH